MADDIKKEEIEILALTRQLTQLMIVRDTQKMNLIVDESFKLTHITGYVQSKEEWFAEIDRRA